MIKDFFGNELPDFKRHGGPWDRGSADYFYRRPYAPHYYVGDTGATDKVPEEKMTSEELDLYKNRLGLSEDHGNAQRVLSLGV